MAMDELDSKAMREIPDPFADEAGAAPRAFDAGTLPAAPTRTRVRAVRAIAAVGAVLFNVAWVFAMGLRADLTTVPPWLLAAGIAAPLAGTVIAISAWARSGQRGLGPTKPLLASLVIAPTILFGVVALVATVAGRDAANLPSTARCLMGTAMLTVVPLVALVIAFRHAFATASRWRTAAIGVTCGALAATTMRLTCINDLPAHVLLGHGAFLVVGGVVGAWIGARFTRA